MLANKNKDIKKAYNLLEIISQDEKARMAYEAREAEIRDQLTRIKTAEEKGKKEEAIKVAKKLLKMGLSIEEVAEIAELEVERVELLKKSILN